MAQLPHSVRIINNNYKDALSELIEKNVHADCVITRFNAKYLFEDEQYCEKDIEILLNLLAACTYKGTHLYMEVPFKDYELVKKGFENSYYQLKNTLILPADLSKLKNPCRMSSFIESDIRLVLFAHNGNFGKLINNTKWDIQDEECSCQCCQNASQYLSNWGLWFHGTVAQSYEVMMHLSTDHGDTVLDPFMAEGDIGSAAIIADRHYIGIEPQAYICKEVATRLDNQGE